MGPVPPRSYIFPSAIATPLAGKVPHPCILAMVQLVVPFEGLLSLGGLHNSSEGHENSIDVSQGPLRSDITL